MSQIGEIVLAMRVASGGFNKGLQSASGALGTFSRGATSTLGGFSRGASGVLSSALTGFAKFGLAIQGVKLAIDGIYSAVSKPLELAANAEQTAVSFEVMLGSAEKAKTVLSDLQKFGAETPFEFPQLADAGKKMLAFGYSAEELVPKMRQLGDISSGLQIPISELAEVVGKMKSADEIKGDELNQLQGRGIPVLKELSQMYGLSTQQIKKLGETGAIKFSHLQAVLDRLTGAGGRFEGMTAKQAKTLGGLWSNVVDNSTKSLTKLGQGIVDAFNLKGLLTKVIAFTDNLGPIMDTALAKIKQVIDWVTPYFLTWVDNLKKEWNLLSSVFLTVAERLQPMWERIAAGMEWLWNSIGPAFDSMQLAFQEIQPIVAQSVDTMVSTFNFFGGVVSTICGSVKTSLGWVLEGIGSLATKAAEYLGVSLPTWETWKSYIMATLQVIEFGFENWQTLLGIAVYGVAAKVVSMANIIVYYFTDVIPAVAIWLRDNWQDIFHDMGEFALTTFKNLGKNIVTVVQNIPALLAGSVAWSDLMTPLLEGAEFTLSQLPDIPERVMGEVEKGLYDDLDRMKGNLGQNWNKFFEDKVARPKIEAPQLSGINDPILGQVAEKPGQAPGQAPGEKPPLGTGTSKKPPFASLAEFGSKEARDTILRGLGIGGKNNQMSKIEQHTKQQVAVTQQLPGRIASEMQKVLAVEPVM